MCPPWAATLHRKDRSPMGTAIQAIADQMWTRAGSMVMDFAPIIGTFVGVGLAVFVAYKLVDMVRGK